MIDLLTTTHGILREAGFNARLMQFGTPSTILSFEDESLMGFGVVYPSSTELLSQWKATETSLLNRFAPTFREAGDKAWNVYCIFLCASAADSMHSRQVRWLEENLDRTRKIAACDLTTRDDLIRALLPILPIQYQPVLRPDDLTERFQARLRAIAPKSAAQILNDEVDPEDIVPLLGAKE